MTNDATHAIEIDNNSTPTHIFDNLKFYNTVFNNNSNSLLYEIELYSNAYI